MDEWGTTEGEGPGEAALRKTAQNAKGLGDELKKVQARGGAIRALAGDFAKAAGAAVGFSLATSQVRASLEAAGRGFDRFRERLALEREFRSFVGGAAAARREVAELAKIAASKGLELAPLGQAALRLRVLSGGALAGRATLERLADAALATENNVADLSGVVGELYRRLSSGEAVADLAEELRNTGVLSAGAAKQVESLQRSGVGVATSFGVVEGELAKFRDRAEEAAGSIDGLSRKIEVLEGARDAGIAAQFAEGVQAGLTAQQRLIDSTADAAADSARPLAALFNGFQRAKLAVVDAVTSWAGFQAAVSNVSTVLASVFVPVIVLSTAATVRLGVQIFALVARAAVASGALGAVGAAAKAMTAVLNLGTLAIGAVVTALTYWNLKILEQRQRLEENARAMRESRSATLETTESLRKQAAATDTLKEKSQLQLTVLEKLAEAERAYAEAQAARIKTAPGTPERDAAIAAETNAANNVQEIKRVYEQVAQIRADSLAPEREALAMAQEREQIERRIAQERQDALADRMTGQSRVDFIRAQKEEAAAKVASGKSEEARFAADQAAFDPLQRASDLARESGAAEDVIGAAKARRDFVNDPARSETFRETQELADREAARARLAKAEQDLETARANGKAESVAPELSRVKTEKLIIGARFGSEDAVTPRSIEEFRQKVRRSMIARGLDPDTRTADNRNLERQRALEDREAQAVREEAERNRQINQEKASIGAQGAAAGLTGNNQRGIERERALAEIRKREIDEQIRIQSTRFGQAGFDDRETQNTIDSLKVDRRQIDVDLRRKEEEGRRAGRFASAELKAQKLERGGNDEAAARVRDAVTLEQRILDLREQGLRAEEATKMARDEQRAARRARQRERSSSSPAEGEATTAMDFVDAGWRLRERERKKALDSARAVQVDSMTAIGGNAGGGGLTSTNGLIRQILDEVRRSNGTGGRSLPTPKWDDDGQPRSKMPF